MKKILVIGLSDNIGGIESFFNTYYKRMDKKKYKFDFAVVTKTIAFGDEYAKNGSEIFSLPSFLKHPLKYKKTLQKIMRRNKYDVVHINMLSAANILPIIAAKKEKIPNIIVHSHNSDTPSGVLRKVLDKANRRYIRKSDFIRVACGKKAGEWLFGKDADFQIIPNAIDITRFKYNEKKRNEIRAKYKILDSEKLIGNVGRLCEQKNQTFLIDVIKKLADNYKLMIIGSGEDKNALVAKIEQMGLADRVLLVDNVPNIEEYYSAMDLFVFPSLFEGMPIAPVEAQANGLRCVCSANVTKEANAGGVEFVQLDMKRWVDYIEKNTQSGRGHKAYSLDYFNISKQVDKLENIYGGDGNIGNDLKISIIVPVFNSGRYIKRCIESLIGQTYDDLEFIFVDDGSIDESGSIVKKYLSDNRVKYIVQRNMGANVARGNGINAATGEYCLFVDSDDWLERTTVETLVGYIKEHHPDMIKFNAYLEPKRRPYISYEIANGKFELINDRESISKILYCTPFLHEMALNIYKTNLIKDRKIFKNNMSFGEDYYVNLHIVPDAKNILFIKDRLYHYDKSNERSTTHTADMKRVEKNIYDTIKLNDKIYKDIKTQLRQSDQKKAIFCILVNYMWAVYSYGCAASKNNMDMLEIFNVIVKQGDLIEIRNEVTMKEINDMIRNAGIKYRIMHGNMIRAIYLDDYNLAIKTVRRYLNGKNR